MSMFPANAISRAASAAALTVLLASFGCEKESAPYQVANAEAVNNIRAGFGGEGGGGGGPAEPAEQPTGFTTLTGRVVLQGDPPPNPVLSITKDLSTCDPNNEPVYYPEIVVGDDGGLANVLIFLDTRIPDDPLWLHDSAKAEEGDIVEFDQKKCMFLSPMFAFQTGQTLRILNSDGIGHNTKGDPSSNPPFNVTVGSNSFVDVNPFTKSERSPFAVSCSVHPWMRAHMFCRDNGYFAVTDENGNFTIPNLPAGVDLEFKIWHEACEFGLSEITVDGSQEPLSRGKWSVRLSPDDGERSVDLVLQADQL